MDQSQVTLHEGDCLEVMRGMNENSVDTVICDPPYGLEFMGKEWDKLGRFDRRDKKTKSASMKRDNAPIGTSPSYVGGYPAQQWHEAWATEALRVAKPGAMLMAFGGTRTHHRLMCAIEDAGWIIRDVVMWVYGSGFPKSHNIGKAIDKTAIVVCPSCYGNKKKRNPDAKKWGEYWLDEPCPECKGTGKITGVEREVVGQRSIAYPDSDTWGIPNKSGYIPTGNETVPIAPGDVNKGGTRDITAPATPAAGTWEGWGTALKPAWEPIILAMKPLDGTFAQNALKWGVAGLWIDGGRVGTEEIKINTYQDRDFQWGIGTSGNGAKYKGETHKGRWPANLIHDGSDEVLAGFPVTGKSNSGPTPANDNPSEADSKIYGWAKYPKMHKSGAHFGDSGSAARFFYCAKASRKERNAGLEGMEDCDSMKWKGGNKMQGIAGNYPDGTPRPPQINKNSHPTVKPLALMRHLCRLSRTPSGGVVLDPFMGSGSTGCAAILEDRSFIGIDKETEYIEIARRRIAHAVKEVKQRQPTLGI